MFWCHARLDPNADTRLSHKTPAMSPGSHKGDRARQQPSNQQKSYQPGAPGVFLRWILLFTVPVASDVPIKPVVSDLRYRTQYEIQNNQNTAREASRDKKQRSGSENPRTAHDAWQCDLLAGDWKYDNLLTISYRACQRQVNTGSAAIPAHQFGRYRLNVSSSLACPRYRKPRLGTGDALFPVLVFADRESREVAIRICRDRSRRNDCGAIVQRCTGYRCPGR